jgi:hypothetical protein
VASPSDANCSSGILKDCHKRYQKEWASTAHYKKQNQQQKNNNENIEIPKKYSNQAHLKQVIFSVFLYLLIFAT